MQIHIQSEHLNEPDVIVHNVLEDERGFSVDLIDNSFDHLGDETGFASPRSGGVASKWERQIWIGRRDACARFLARRKN